MPSDASVEEDIFPAGEVRVKARADFQQILAMQAFCADLAHGIGPMIAGKQFQQCAFAGSVAADDAEDFTSLHFKRNPSQGPHLIGGQIGGQMGAREEDPEVNVRRTGARLKIGGCSLPAYLFWLFRRTFQPPLCMGPPCRENDATSLIQIMPQ